MNTRRIITRSAVVVALAAVLALPAQSQTYKVDFATAVKLASGGTDISKLFTLTAPAGMPAGLNWVLPTTNGANGYILGTDGSGNLSWVNPAMGVALAGDVTGSAGANTVARINGIRLGTMANAAAGKMLVYNSDSTAWIPVALTGDIAITGSGGVTVNTYGGGTTFGTMAHQDYNNVGISGGNINGTVIGDTLAAAGTFTNLTVTGTATLPAGSITASSLGLTDGKIFIGDASNHAAAQSLSQDVTITNAGVASVKSVQTAAGSTIASAINSNALNLVNGDNIKHDATLRVASNNLGIDTSHANTWTGTQTFGATAYSASSIGLAGVTNDLAASAASSFIQLAPTGPDTLTSIATPIAGRMVTLVNTSGTYAVTLASNAATGTDANKLNIPGGENVILGPAGSVTLLYDASISRWRMINY